MFSILRNSNVTIRQIVLGVVNNQNNRHLHHASRIISNLTFYRPGRHQHVRRKTYKAAILEEFDKPMIITKVKNDAPLGTEMVSIINKMCKHSPSRIGYTV